MTPVRARRVTRSVRPAERVGRAREDALAKKATKKKASKKKAAAGDKAVVPAKSSGPTAVPAAIKAFEDAIAPFHKRDFRKATDKLNALLDKFPEDTDVLDRVRTYLLICERELDDKPYTPKTADDKYDLAVMRLNAGELDEAIELLKQAVKGSKAADRAEYTLAAALALAEHNADALEHLRTAVELNPDNRIFAAQDSDFEILRDEVEFQELVGRRSRRA